jgi:hypothetical protein
MDETSVPAGLSDAAEWLFAFAAIVLLGCHLLLKSSDRRKGLRLLTALVLLAALLIVIGLVSARPLVRFSTIITCVFVYAVSLFVAHCFDAVERRKMGQGTGLRLLCA